MSITVRPLHQFIVFFVILNLVISPLLAFGSRAEKTYQLPFPTKPIFNALTPIAPHAEHRLLLKFRDDASLEERSQIVENYGEPELQPRRVGESVLTLKLKENVSTALAELKRMDRIVEWVEPDYVVSGRMPGIGGRQTLSRSLHNPLAAKNLTPKAAVVAIIDTGLSGKYKSGWNFLNDSENFADDNGHGTEMARIITEVNPKVSLMPLKALDSDGIGTVSKIAAAIDYATNNHAGVILHSFGTSEPSKLVEEAIKRAEMAGVVLVAAAGNDGLDLEQTPQYPAASKASNLITVAASTKKNELADYSNYGKGVHVAALGEGANELRGTSMAAARVAGIASLLKAERPWVSAGTIKSTLMKSAKRSEKLKVESGAVDAKAAVAEFQNPKPDDKVKDDKTKEPKKVNRQLEARRQKLKDEEKEKEAKHPYHDADMPNTAHHDLDHTRNEKPQEPEGRVRTNSLQPAGYHDPVPTSSANFSSYFTEMTKSGNDIGMAGSKPMQMVDPTAGTSVIGGMSVNLGSKNLNFTAPALSLGGRAGMNLSLGLTYNSQVWFKNPATNTMVYNADRGNVAPGWRIGFGAIQGINSSGQVGPYSNSVTGKQSFLYLQPDGTRRDLAYNATTLKYESYDSSYLQFDATTKILKTTSGSQIKFNVSATAAGEFQLLPTEIKDRNGNFITVTYKLLSNNDTVIDYVTDTLGRRIDFYYVSNKLKEIRQDRNGTIFKYLVIDYTAVTLTNGFTSTAGYYDYVYDPDTGDLISQTWVPPTTISMDVSSATAYLPSRLTYPTGTNLRMYYTSYGQIHKFEKWVPTITGQGTERIIARTRIGMYSVGGASYPASTVWGDGGAGDGVFCPYFTQRNENNENWLNNTATWATSSSDGVTYYYGYGTNSAGVTEPASPRGTYPNSHSITNSGLVQTTVITGQATDASTGSSINATLKTIVNTYTKDTGISYNSNLRPIESKITDQSAHTRKVGLTYIQQDGLWLVQNKDDYDAAGTAVYRRTTMTYTSYPVQRILGLPLTSATYAGAGTTLLAKTENVYDETSSYSDSGGGVNPYFANAGATVQHDDTNYGASFTTRGNLTTVKQYATNNASVRVIGRTGYDTNGNVRNAADAAGNRKQIDYTDYFTNKPSSLGSLQAYVKTTADPVNMKAGAQYEYYTGLPTKSFVINPSVGTEEQITTMTYDSADRPVQTTKPNGSWASVSYWDNLLRQTTNTKHDVVNGQDQIVASFQDFDGAGRVLRKGSDHPNAVSGKYSGQKFKYDELGRGVEQSQILMVDSSFNPDPAETGQGDWKFTKASFDGMNRTTSVQKPDNTYIFSDYSVCGCAGGLVNTTYDEKDNQKVSETDFLGRLKYAREFEPYILTDDFGNTYIDHYDLRAQVEYIYDNLDRLVTINHTGTPYYTGNNPQVRSFTYDIWGRLASETTPEAGTVTYTYTANDQVATTTNARGVTTTVAYNNRNLVTGVTYSDPTPASTYTYDNYSARTAMTDGEGSMSYVYNSYRQLQSETRTFTGLTGNNYTYNYTYGLGGQLKQANYVAPSFNTNVNYAYKASGALQGIGTNLIGTDPNANANVVSDLAYTSFGAAKTLNYGNNRKMTMEYDYSLGRLNRQTLARPDGTNKLVDYLYSYEENGLLSQVSNYVDEYYGTGFRYNFRNQLTQVASGFSGVNYNRQYNYWYDDWGNLTRAEEMWYGPSQGTFTFAKIPGSNYTPVNNRPTSNTKAGVTTNFTYDLSGNMTAAGSTTYQWDGANRLKSVNTGTLGSYGYDGNGKRVKKTEGGASTYYVYSSVIGSAVMEVASAGVKRAYVMNGGGVVAQRNADGQFYWLHPDHLGSGRKMTDTSGNLTYRAEFDPYGKLLYEWSLGSQANRNSRKFTGYERDAGSGLDYAQARMYGSEWGRFMSPDPKGLAAANKQSPMSFNRYSYVQGNPANATDPNGEDIVVDLRFFLSSLGSSCNIYSSGADGFWSLDGLLPTQGRIYCDMQITREIQNALTQKKKTKEDEYDVSWVYGSGQRIADSKKDQYGCKKDGIFSVMKNGKPLSGNTAYSIEKSITDSITPADLKSPFDITSNGKRVLFNKDGEFGDAQGIYFGQSDLQGLIEKYGLNVDVIVEATTTFKFYDRTLIGSVTIKARLGMRLTATENNGKVTDVKWQCGIQITPDNSSESFTITR